VSPGCSGRVSHPPLTARPRRARRRLRHAGHALRASVRRPPCRRRSGRPTPARVPATSHRIAQPAARRRPPRRSCYLSVYLISPITNGHRITQPDCRHVAEDTESHPDQPAVELPEDEAELVETPGGDELTERAATLATARTKLTGDLSPGGAVCAFPASRVACDRPVLRASEAGAPGRIPRATPATSRQFVANVGQHTLGQTDYPDAGRDPQPGDATPRTTLRPGSSGHGSVGWPDPDTTASAPSAARHQSSYRCAYRRRAVVPAIGPRAACATAGTGGPTTDRTRRRLRVRASCARRTHQHGVGPVARRVDTRRRARPTAPSGATARDGQWS
jgi:hypothetical protein